MKLNKILCVTENHLKCYFIILRKLGFVDTHKIFQSQLSVYSRMNILVFSEIWNIGGIGSHEMLSKSYPGSPLR